jgi:hypothetical protein
VNVHACPNCGFELRPLEKNAGDPDERMYTLSELETKLNLSRRTLKQLIYDKKLRASKLTEGPGAGWRVGESALAEFRRAREESAT